MSDDARAVPIADLPAVKVVMTMIGCRVEYGSTPGRPISATSFCPRPPTFHEAYQSTAATAR